MYRNQKPFCNFAPRILQNYRNMKKHLLTLVATMLSVMAIAQEQAPAFPGAEGHGRYVTGGRGKTVVHVTNLNNSGTGSFRSAVSSSNRIVVFDVAGVKEPFTNINTLTFSPCQLLVPPSLSPTVPTPRVIAFV